MRVSAIYFVYFKIGSILLPGDDIRPVTDQHNEAKQVCQFDYFTEGGSHFLKPTQSDILKSYSTANVTLHSSSLLYFYTQQNCAETVLLSKTGINVK